MGSATTDGKDIPSLITNDWYQLTFTKDKNPHCPYADHEVGKPHYTNKNVRNHGHPEGFIIPGEHNEIITLEAVQE
jgi:hypothetical protein